jgi:hypothetical protein
VPARRRSKKETKHGAREKARGLTEGVPEVEKWSVEETDVLYEKSLGWSAEIASKAASGESDESRQKVWAEFKEFLAKNAYRVTVETAAAEDILAFVRGYWIPRHVGSCQTVAKHTGQKVAAVATVKQVLKHLSKCLNSMLGRDGGRNPVRSEAVASFKEGYYRKMLHELGVREKKAVVFKEGKVDDLVRSLRDRIAGMSKGIERCCSIMDLTAVLYLWETWVRGKECGSLEKRQVHKEEGIVAESWSKTVQNEPSSIINVRQEESRMAISFLEATALLIKECEAIDQPVGDGFLFRPLTRDRKSFRPKHRVVEVPWSWAPRIAAYVGSAACCCMAKFVFDCTLGGLKSRSSDMA